MELTSSDHIVEMEKSQNDEREMGDSHFGASPFDRRQPIDNTVQFKVC